MKRTGLRAGGASSRSNNTKPTSRRTRDIRHNKSTLARHLGVSRDTIRRCEQRRQQETPDSDDDADGEGDGRRRVPGDGEGRRALHPVLRGADDGRRVIPQESPRSAAREVVAVAPSPRRTPSRCARAPSPGQSSCVQARRRWAAPRPWVFPSPGRADDPARMGRVRSPGRCSRRPAGANGFTGSSFSARGSGTGALYLERGFTLGRRGTRGSHPGRWTSCRPNPSGRRCRRASASPIPRNTS